MPAPVTEYQAQQNNQVVETNAQAAMPVPMQAPVATSAAQYHDPYNEDIWKKEWEKRQKDAFTPPSNDEIEKEMWIGSFMSALMVGLVTGDPAGAIVGGLWGAIAIHDYGYQLQQRADDIPGLQKAGYSMPAIRAYYDDGDTKLLDQERDDMRADRQMEQQLDMQGKQIDAADRRQAAQIEASDRRQAATIAAADARQNKTIGVMLAKGAAPTELERNISAWAKMPDGPAKTAIGVKLGVMTAPMNVKDQLAADNATITKRLAAQKQQDSLMNTLTQVDDLLGRDLSSGFGMGQDYIPNDILTDHGQGNQSRLKAIKNNQFLSNAGTLTGGVTDKDAESLQGSVVNMQQTDSAETMRDNLLTLRSRTIELIQQNQTAANLQGVPIDAPTIAPLAPTYNEPSELKDTRRTVKEMIAEDGYITLPDGTKVKARTTGGN